MKVKKKKKPFESLSSVKYYQEEDVAGIMKITFAYSAIFVTCIKCRNDEHRKKWAT